MDVLETNIKISDPKLLIHSPGQLRVIKREGNVVQFDPLRIATAMKKAFIASEGDAITHSERIQQTANRLTNEVIIKLQHNWVRWRHHTRGSHSRHGGAHFDESRGTQSRQRLRAVSRRAA